MATPPDFSSGAVLTAAQMNSVGLWLVKTQTVGNAVSSVTVSSAFSADYNNYRIVISNVNASVGDQMIALTVGGTTGNYFSASRSASYAGGDVANNRNNQSTAYTFQTATSNETNGSFDIFQPFLANRTTWSGSAFTWVYNTTFGGQHTVATSYSSFTLAPASGTFTGGTIKVYGYRN